MSLTEKELFGRYKTACDLKMSVDIKKIQAFVNLHYIALGLVPKTIKMFNPLSDARAACGACDAPAARAAWDAWDVWDARAASAAWAAWAARDARAASAAWAAWAVWDAWDARTARNTRNVWDNSWVASICLGALETKNEKVISIYYPLFEAFEAGLWLFWYGEKHFCIIARPELKVENMRLHCATGPAFKLPEEELFYLNGVLVDKSLVLTPAEKLDPHILLTEKNAEVRREIVRKIGMERIILKLGAKSLDRQGEYELLLFNLGDGRERPYLKMRNPSIQTWHIEGVPMGTKTVAEALNFRKPEALRKIATADNGQDWYQQGDVCIWPRDAKFIKTLPAIIT